MVAFAGMTTGQPAPALATSDPNAGHDVANIEQSQQRSVELEKALGANEAALAAVKHNAATSSAPTDSDLKQLLAELVSQNGYLRDQIAETNRDMMELQFRVDSHSEQFRPLEVADELTYDPTIGVLPPRDLP